MDTTGLGDVLAVRMWINQGSQSPVGMKDMAEFWKSLSQDEKTQFGNEARASLATV